MITIRRLLASLLAISISGTSAPMPAQAALLGTDAVLAPATQPERDRIAGMLNRAEVRAQLGAYGVSPADIQARVAALTDDEAAQLAAHIETLPAGGIVGAIVLVFLVLLLTDILGLTKVFPFTRPIR